MVKRLPAVVNPIIKHSMDQTPGSHEFGQICVFPPTRSLSQLGDENEAAGRLPDDDYSPPRKGPAKVAVAEHSSDRPLVPRLRASTKSVLISKAKQHALAPALLSTNKFKMARSQGAQHSAFMTILPRDIYHLLATQYLDFDTLLALRQTCRAAHQLLTSNLIRRIRAQLVKKSLEHEISQYREYRSKYPRQRLGHLWDLLYAAFDFRLIERPARNLCCYGCLETKPLWCFVERMSNRGTGLGAKSAKDRMCKECMRRYRDIEGEWWKENWIKKSDTVRKQSRSRRIRRWAFQGGSLTNPAEEVGICASCGSGTSELWWGCVSCFEVEEQRRRKEDMMDFAGVERKIIDFVEGWRIRMDTKRRKKQATRDRRQRKGWAPRFNISFRGSIADREAALMEWKGSRGNPTSGSNTTRGITGEHKWRALNQIPLPQSRREARCRDCWAPNCRTYILGLAYERPLGRERWCAGCQHEHDLRHARRQERMTTITATDPDLNGIFSNEWDDGLGLLFDED